MDISSAPPAPTITHRGDYLPPEWLVPEVSLDFALGLESTVVKAALQVRRNGASPTIRLKGDALKAEAVTVDGVPTNAWRMDDGDLLVDLPGEAHEIGIETRIAPAANTQLMGLYASNGMLCTQCEAEGFRRITFFPDRPDVLSTYRVRMSGDKALFPVLLANGNCTARGEGESGAHWAEWHDPWPKPSYLFALVAGDLVANHDTFTTCSGRTVDLNIWVREGDQDRTGHAMQALKHSMKWDEETFGREYDLDLFNVVAVSDFNMGAMENKGLNVFNTRYILADPDTATDADYDGIESVVAHEYFHNWSGNRVTCRDWFQLSLKEGFTVFRDQQFSADQGSAAVKRIEDVRTLRAAQFPEDAGPLAHPVRPESYIEIDNFYTATVYEKGAEVVRMLHSLLGPEDFRKATDLYFARHDGEAATVEDFLACMSEASGRNLTQLKRWYEQAGTPKVKAETRYDEISKTFTLTLTQATPPTPNQQRKVPFHIPLSLGLLDASGNDMPLHLDGVGTLNTPLIELTEEQTTFRFRDVHHAPVLSLNRGFSAPVMVEVPQDEAQQLFLMGYDADSFNRWEAGQSLATSLIVKTIAGEAAHADAFAAALGKTLADGRLDDAFKALTLKFPTEQEIAAKLAHDVDADQVRAARNKVLAHVAGKLRSQLLKLLDGTQESGPYVPDSASTGRRALRYAALALLARADEAAALKAAEDDFHAASSMTAETGAIAAVLPLDDARVPALLDAFYQRHRNDALLVDKWFLFESSRPLPDAAGHVRQLLVHPDFNYTTPNRVYAVLGGFAGNQAGFHAADGSGYALLADGILKLNGINPQVAARMATSFRTWRLFEAVRRGHAEAQLRRILVAPALSRDVYEIISRTLSG